MVRHGSFILWTWVTYLHTPLLCDGCCDVLDLHGNSFSVFNTILEYLGTEDMTQCCLCALDQSTMDIRNTEFGLVGIDNTPKERVSDNP